MGAYAISTGTIYLNVDWLAGASKEQVISVLTEELGHHLDGLLNASDTLGDEGEIFAKLLLFKAVSKQDQFAIQQQNDKAFARVGGERISIEQAAIGAISDTFTIQKGDTLAGNLLLDNGGGADLAGSSVIEVDGQIVLSAGATTVTTGSGATITIDSLGNFTYNAGAADDRILPNKLGSDTFNYTILNGGISYSASVTLSILNTVALIPGTDQADQLLGTDLDNEIDGREGNDIISGKGGFDVLQGGDGNDTIDGGSGDDLLIGDPQVILGSKTTQSKAFDATGDEITLSLTLPNYVSKEGSVLSGLLSLSGPSTSAINIVYIVDISGSTSSIFSGSEAIGDLNGNGRASEIIDAEISGFNALTNSLINSGLADVNIGVVAFQTGATVGFSGTAAQDSDNNGVRDIEAYLRTLQAGGLTSYDQALNSAITYLNSRPPGKNYIYFLSDGFHNGGSYASQVITLTSPTGLNTTIRAIGVGNGASITDLDLVDDGILNSSANITLSPSQLAAGLVASSLKLSEISRVEIYSNGLLVETLANSQLQETPLGIQFQSALTNISTINNVEARAFLVDGTQISAQGRSAPADFNDTLLGGEGNDTLDGGVGTDTAYYDAPRNEFNVISDAVTGITTIDHQGGSRLEGFDTLTNIEFARFSDGIVLPLPTLNSSPRCIVPLTTIQVEQGRSSSIAGASVEDLDTPVLSVTLKPTNGNVSIGSAIGVTIRPQPAGVLIMVGSAVALSTALASLQFIGSSIGLAQLELIVDDGNTQASKIISLNVLQPTISGTPPVNSLPSPPSPAPLEGSTISIPGFSVFDADSNIIKVTITPSGGSIVLQASGSSVVTAKALGTFEITGNQQDVNSTLATLAFTAGTGVNQAAIQMVSSDGVYTDIDNLVFSIDVNEAPTDLVFTSSGIQENSVGGTVIGTLAGVDPDTGSSFTYELVAGDGTNDADNSRVVIVGNEVKVAPNAVIDFEVNPVLNLNIRVTDNGNPGLTFIKAVTASVIDVFEDTTPPTLTSISTQGTTLILKFSETIAALPVSTARVLRGRHAAVAGPGRGPRRQPNRRRRFGQWGRTVGGRSPPARHGDRPVSRDPTFGQVCGAGPPARPVGLRSAPGLGRPDAAGGSRRSG
jgi:hypothetical protein